MDIALLEKTIAEKGAANIGAVILTVTNNSGGGQPVSMENAKSVANVCRKNKVLFVIDCCCVKENSYYIHHNEAGYGNKLYRQIAEENDVFGRCCCDECLERCISKYGRISCCEGC